MKAPMRATKPPADPPDRLLQKDGRPVVRRRDGPQLASGLRKAVLITQLTDKHKAIIELMVFGADKKIGTIPPGTPLTIEQIAPIYDFRRTYLRYLTAQPLVMQYYLARCEALRKGEKARNIRTLITIRDSIGDDTAADKAVRIKAVAALEGTASTGTTVNVAINNQPGYVIRLPASPNHPPTINGTAQHFE